MGLFEDGEKMLLLYRMSTVMIKFQRFASLLSPMTISVCTGTLRFKGMHSRINVRHTTDYQRLNSYHLYNVAAKELLVNQFPDIQLLDTCAVTANVQLIVRAEIDEILGSDHWMNVAVCALQKLWLVYAVWTNRDIVHVVACASYNDTN